MANSAVANDNAIKMKVTGFNNASDDEQIRCYITVSNEYDTHVVIKRKNSKGHWEMENRTEFPDWVLEMEADYIRLTKTEERK